jgi:hypothetical protein
MNLSFNMALMEQWNPAEQDILSSVVSVNFKQSTKQQSTQLPDVKALIPHENF